MWKFPAERRIKREKRGRRRCIADRTALITTMGRIIFYEGRNFQGRYYECSSDCADVHLQLSRCNSCRVDSGLFVLYEKPNFTGLQVLVRPGEYPDSQRLMGLSAADCIQSCRMIPVPSPVFYDSWPGVVVPYCIYLPPQHRSQFCLRIYECENFGGQMRELMEDCQSLQERYSMSDCQSCNVTDGHWLLFEQPGFRGRMVYLRPGEYRSLRDASTGRFSSVQRIMEAC
uniref:Beta/gamma crystallin 'Greek key' domain-containing protein n=1 Tax=Oryzias sinensis TaxID=183150 RepID=A0A8C7WVW8_9TELE